MEGDLNGSYFFGAETGKPDIEKYSNIISKRIF